MQIILVSIIFVCFTAFLTHLTLSRIRLTTRQRLRLIEIYSNLFFSIKLNYKNKEAPSLFRDKQDFLFFKYAFKHIFPYIEGKKIWSDLSDWDMGMLVEHLIKATDMYPDSNAALFIEQSLPEIALRSCVLLFPKRINLFMHFDNKNGKFLVGNIDFTPIKDEAIALSKGKKYNQTAIHHKIKQPKQYIEVIKYLRTKNNWKPLIPLQI